MAASSKISTPVLIAGGGPVGLTAALDLASRGVKAVLIEQLAVGETQHVKSNHVSSRSMEIFRRLGLAERIRQSGLPSNYPNDVAYLTSIAGPELGRIRIPSVDERQRGALIDAPDMSWPTPEPPHRINQRYLEPVLFDAARSAPELTILNRARLEGFVQTETHLLSQIRNLETNEVFEICSEYLIGCDGAQSTVRRQLGIKFRGDAELLRNLSTFIRSPELHKIIKARPFWMAEIISERRTAAILAIDGKDHWLIHIRMPRGVTDFASVDRDQAIREVLGVGADFDYEVLSKEDWVARRLVAERMRSARVFLCGDAAHIWIPNAGYGMNAGIADATNLSWMLAAVLNRWAPASILDGYELERHPITEQVSRFVAAFGLNLHQKRLNPPSGLGEHGPEGDRIRAAFGAELVKINRAQFFCAGLNFGYYYDQSPLIVYDGTPAPPYSMDHFVPSNVPGCRAPHVWLGGRRSLYDELGTDFTLLRRDTAINCDRFLMEAAGRKIPIKLLDVDTSEIECAYERQLTLIRPDRHIAWRGDVAPGSVVLDRITGAAPKSDERADDSADRVAQ